MKRKSGLTGAENAVVKRGKKAQRNDAEQQQGVAAVPGSACDTTSAGTREMSSMQFFQTPTKTKGVFSHRSSVPESPFHQFASDGLADLTPARSASGLGTTLLTLDDTTAVDGFPWNCLFTPSKNTVLADKQQQEQILSPTERHNILQKSLGQAKQRSLIDCIGRSPASASYTAEGICIDESFSPFINKENPKDNKDTFSPFINIIKGITEYGCTPPPPRGDASKQEPASVTGEVGTFFAGKTPQTRTQNLLGSQRRLNFEFNPIKQSPHDGPTRPLEPDSHLQDNSNDSIAISSASAASAIPINADVETESSILLKLLRGEVSPADAAQQAPPEASASSPPTEPKAAVPLFPKQEEQQQPQAIAAGFAAAAAAAAAHAQSSAAASEPAAAAAPSASEAASLQPEALPMLPTPPAPMSQQGLDEALRLVAGHPELLKALLQSQAAGMPQPPIPVQQHQDAAAAAPGPQLQAMQAAIAAQRAPQPNLAVTTAALPAVAPSQPSAAAVAAAAASGAMSPSKRKPCNCSKTKCIKLYCDCFKMGLFCKDCNCRDCQNTAEHVNTVRTQQQSIMQRDPEAFTKKIGSVEASGKAEHVKGCNCKKSKCRKKYCECFQAGVLCGASCKCNNCENNDTAPDPTKPDEIARIAQKA